MRSKHNMRKRKSGRASKLATFLLVTYAAIPVAFTCFWYAFFFACGGIERRGEKYLKRFLRDNCLIPEAAFVSTITNRKGSALFEISGCDFREYVKTNLSWAAADRSMSTIFAPFDEKVLDLEGPVQYRILRAYKIYPDSLLETVEWAGSTNRNVIQITWM
ncbi:MAG: hypothetical protein IJ678_02250 [Kiritimatiellae bacterium]|nr:hypothetical protein [Kiritimatiellia bacterium]